MNLALLWALTAVEICAAAPIPMAVKPAQRPYTFVVTARLVFEESPPSNEVEVWRTNGFPSTVILRWDPSPSTNVGWVEYWVYKGRTNGAYYTNYDAGDKLMIEVPLVDPYPTNRIVTFSASCNGVWTNLTFTNTQGTLFLRSSTTLQRGIWTVRAEAANDVEGPWASWSAFWPTWTSTTNPGSIKLGATNNVVW